MSSIFDWVWGAIQSVAEWLYGIIGSVWDGLWTWLGDLLSQLGVWILSVLPAGWAAWLMQKPWEDLNQFLNFVDYWVPIYTGGGIIISVVVMVGSIRLVRAVLRIAPVVNG